MSWIITGTQKNKGLLDEFSGAAAAYSLRDLSLLRNVPVVRVRRDNDDAEQDFTATEVSDGTLAAWVGAGNNGFVRTWYDQSGNGYNAEQSSFGNQPKLVSNGIVIVSNGRASIEFGGGTGVMSVEIDAIRSANNLSSFAVIQPSPASAPNTTPFVLFGYADGGGDTSNPGFQIGAATGVLANETYCVYWSSVSLSTRLGSSTYQQVANEQSLQRAFFLSSGFAAAKNGQSISINLAAGTTVDQSPSATGAASDLVYIASISGSPLNFSQKYQELLFYFDDKSTSAANIEANINAHYSIY